MKRLGYKMYPSQTPITGKATPTGDLSNHWSILNGSYMVALLACLMNTSEIFWLPQLLEVMHLTKQQQKNCSENLFKNEDNFSGLTGSYT